MKRKKKESKSLKPIQFIVLVLFIVLLFAPKRIDRTVIAGIALAGTTGSIFFLLVFRLIRNT